MEAERVDDYVLISSTCYHGARSHRAFVDFFGTAPSVGTSSGMVGGSGLDETTEVGLLNGNDAALHSWNRTGFHIQMREEPCGAAMRRRETKKGRRRKKRNLSRRGPRSTVDLTQLRQEWMSWWVREVQV